MSQVPSVLLLTRTPPGSGSVGQIVLRDLILMIPSDKVCCFVIGDESFGTPSPELGWMPIFFFGRVSRGAVRKGLKIVNGFLTFLKHQYHRYITSRLIARSAIKFVSGRTIDVVWANLNDPIVIYTAKKVADSIGAQLLTSVWDPPERFFHQMDARSSQGLLKDFGNALSASERCAVISEEMRDLYDQKYGVKTVVLRHGLSQAAQYPPGKSLVKNDELVIGFAGSQYAIEEWDALLDALDRSGWQVNSRKVVIRLLGARFTLKSKTPARVEFLGWRSVAETAKYLSQTDVLYLPYMFNSKDDAVARLSFPTKLTTYLSAGRPIFFHGPRHSTPARFIREYNVGYGCFSLDSDQIIECLTRFTLDDTSYMNMALAGRSVFKDEFTLDVFRQRLAEFLGVTSDDLVNALEAS